MKKTLFTICSIVAVSCAIIVSCTKDNTSGEYHVGYYVQPSSTPGSTLTTLNPNPNGNPYNVITPTVAPTPTTTTYGSITLSTGSSVNFSTSPSCSSTSWAGTDGGTNSLTLTFPAAPSANTYSIVTSTPTGNQVTVSYNGSMAQGGNVSVVASGAAYTASFSGVAFPTFTATVASLKCH
jgi:hypothetical protein